MSSLPLSPDFPPRLASQEDFWDGIDLTAIAPLDFDAIAQTMPLEIPLPQEDERVTDLERLVTEAILPSMDMNQWQKCKETLKKQLAHCTAILNPSEKLQFLRLVASILLSDDEEFVCHFEKAPCHLPIPLSLNWIANLPVTVKIASPVHRALLMHRFTRSSEYEPYYNELIQKFVVEVCKLQEDRSTSGILITIGQHQNRYNYKFSLQETVLFFFSEQLADTMEAYPLLNYSPLFLFLAAPFLFSLEDPRLTILSSSTVPFLDNLLVSGALANILKQRSQIPDRSFVHIEQYLLVLMYQGILRHKVMLLRPLLLSLFEAVAIVSEKCTPAFSFLIFESLERLKEKNAKLADEILQLPSFEKLKEGSQLRKPKNYAYLAERKERLYILCESYDSYLVKDLLVSANIDWRSLEIEALQCKKAHQALLNASAKPALPASSVSAEQFTDLLRGIFFPGMIQQWQEMAGYYQKSGFEAKYMQLLQTYLAKTSVGPALFYQEVARGIFALFSLISPNRDPYCVKQICDVFKMELWAKAIQIPLANTAAVLFRSREHREWLLSVLSYFEKDQYLFPVIKQLQEVCKTGSSIEAYSQALQPFSLPNSLQIKGRQLFNELWLRSALLKITLLAERKNVSLQVEIVQKMKPFFVACPDAEFISQFAKRIMPSQTAKYAPVTGLPNRGNTCFVNAALQALFAQNHFQQLLQKEVAPKHLPLQKALRNLTERKELHVSLEQLLTILYNTIPDLKNQRNRLHDVAPVLEELLEAMQYPLQSEITYQGLEEYGHLYSTKKSPMPLLRVSLQSRSVDLQMLVDNEFSQEEIRDEKNPWKATDEHGNEIVVTKYRAITKLADPLPEMLVVQLKRFMWDGALQPDLTTVPFEHPLKIGSARYKLSGCIQFNPVLQHYSAEVLKNNDWYLCDDTHVEKIAKPSPEKAYILFLQNVNQ